MRETMLFYFSVVLAFLITVLLDSQGLLTTPLSYLIVFTIEVTFIFILIDTVDKVSERHWRKMKEEEEREYEEMLKKRREEEKDS